MSENFTRDDFSGESDCRIGSEDLGMVFTMAQKLNAILGLSEDEVKWLTSLGAKFELDNDAD